MITLVEAPLMVSLPRLMFEIRTFRSQLRPHRGSSNEKNLYLWLVTRVPGLLPKYNGVISA